MTVLSQVQKLKVFNVTAAIVLILGFIQIQGQTLTSSCGRLAPIEASLISRISNTYETRQDWPWHAAIYHNTTLNSGYKCGGTVISSKSILTAAHCVHIDNMTLDAKAVSVILGRVDLRDIGQSVEVAEIIVHPKFNSSDLHHDIAIITLSTEVTFNKYVQPICLWDSSKTNVTEIHDKLGTVVGWGLTEEGRISNVLRQATLPVVSYGTCLKSNPDVFGRLISDTNFCAGHRNGTAVCQGDSGGSITFGENGIYYIRGVVSVGPSKADPITQEVVCDPSQYALFTDVAQYLSWIGDTAMITICETTVKCSFYDTRHSNCVIVVQHSAQKCKIIFDEESGNGVMRLYVRGEFDVIPYISDAVIKFKLIELTLVRAKLKIVERSKLAPFKENLTTLKLSSNEISHLSANTFDDLTNLKKLFLNKNYVKEVPADIFNELTNLEVLHLGNNTLKELPANIFKELLNLRYISLIGNELTILPQDLFRYNTNLIYVDLANNRINRIECDFNAFPNLQILDLTGNICTNEKCVKPQSFDEIFDKIRKNCIN